MPKSSSALAASFMISRSESDPITMETSGLSAIKSFLEVNLFWRSQGAGPDILAVVHVFKADQARRLICAADRLLQPRRPGRHAQHTPAAGVENPIALAGSGVKDLHPGKLAGAVQSGDLFAAEKAPGISARSHYHAAGSVA